MPVQDLKRKRPLTSKVVMAKIDALVSRKTNGIRNLLRHGYELGLWTAEEQGWANGCFYVYWLVAVSEHNTVAREFELLRAEIDALDFVADVEVSEYHEPEGHGFVGLTGDVMTELLGERWIISFNRIVNYDHGRYQVAGHTS